MTYWLLTSEYPPFFGGGISTYCYYTAQMLVEKGHTVTVFTNDATVKDIEETTLDGVRIVRFNPNLTNTASFLGHVTNISYAFAHTIRLFIEKEGAPDLIEAQEYLGIAYYLLQYKHLLYDWCKDVPVLITMHSPSFLYMEYNHVSMYRYPNYWICEMERYCLQAADLLISPSQFMLTELGARFTLNNTSVTIIPNPFSGKHFKLERQKGVTENEIVFYGKLTVQKGAFKLLQYFKQLWDDGFLRPLFLLGGQDIVYHPEGKTMGDIIRKQYQPYIEKGLLKLEDRISPSQISTRLAKAEVVIVPSCNDNLPYVVFEMMALGKVLLVSKQGGQSEVIQHGVNGFVFDHERPETFGVQLKKILALSQKEKETFSNKAIADVTRHYSLDAVYERKMAFIQSYLKQPQKKLYFPFVRPGKEATPINDISATKGLLSVVVTFYNMGAYVQATIVSLQSISYTQTEIIIINDGSNEENSLNILAQYRNTPGIKVIDTPNRGLAHARNFGAELAMGEYLAFLDADDKVDPEYYAKAIKILQHYQNVHFVGAWTKYFEGSQKTWPTFSPEPPLILYHNTVNSSALVYKRASFLSGGRNDMRMTYQGLEDYESVISLLHHGMGGVVLPEPLFHYRVRANSMIRDISKTKKLVLYQYISNKHKDFYGKFAADVFNFLNANGPGLTMDNPSLDLHLADKLPIGGMLSGKLIALIKKNKYARLIAYRVYRTINK